MADQPSHSDTGEGSDREPTTGTPRWVKVSLIIGIVLVLLLVVMLISGHGPGRHMHGGLGGRTPLSSSTADGGQQ